METRMPPPSGRYGPSATPTPPSSGPRRLLARFPVVLGAAAGLAVVALALVILLLTHPAPAPAQPPDNAARAICANLRAQSYAALYAQLTPRLRGLGTQDQF